MTVLRGSGALIFLILWMLNVSLTNGIRADLYINKDKFGEFLRMDISEKGCTNVPLNWDNQAYSLDTHGSCIKFYDLPYCRGKYVALQPYHSTFQDNLEALGFKQLISSASPCGPKVPSGRYYILNGADGSVLTIDKKDNDVIAKTMPFKPYITKNQQFQIDKISIADYEIIPRVHEDKNPVTFDMSVSTKQHPVRRTWKIESVYRGKYVIKNEWNNRCLYKSEKGKVEEHDCVSWSPNQEWMFKAIKVQPFFPSKDEINKKPIKPDEQLPFQPQQDVFPQFHVPQIHFHPGQPLRDPNKRRPQNDVNQPFERPNPIVLNPREPFPPIQPIPILPQSSLRPRDPSKPPVPHVHHPGRLPFPQNPVVTDPKLPIWPPTLFGQFGPTQQPKLPPKKINSDEDQDEKEEDEDKEGDDKEDEDKENGDDKEDEDKENGDDKEDDDEDEKEAGDNKQEVSDKDGEAEDEPSKETDQKDDNEGDDDTSNEQKEDAEADDDTSKENNEESNSKISQRRKGSMSYDYEDDASAEDDVGSNEDEDESNEDAD